MIENEKPKPISDYIYKFTMIENEKLRKISDYINKLEDRIIELEEENKELTDTLTKYYNLEAEYNYLVEELGKRLDEYND